MKKVTFTLLEVSNLTGLDLDMIDSWIDKEWLSPPIPGVLDHEDVARLRLIHELQNDFGANEEAVPLILHLVDQLCHFREQLRLLKEKSS